MFEIHCHQSLIGISVAGTLVIKRPVGEDVSVGAKRTLTVLLASGKYCVNFDDDDLYGDK